jgi:hypothetical protein
MDGCRTRLDKLGAKPFPSTMLGHTLRRPSDQRNTPFKTLKGDELKIYLDWSISNAELLYECNSIYSRANPSKGGDAKLPA